MLFFDLLFGDGLFSTKNQSECCIFGLQNKRFMKLDFYKYHGAGNDFIMIDNRQLLFPKNDTNLVLKLCHRRFGIGADGLILLENSEVEGEDFVMVYYNSDGNPSSMCGNGGRCIVAFANFLGVIGERTNFIAVDGKHKAWVKGETISLQMQDVIADGLNEGHLFLDTGSPHHIEFSTEVGDLDVKKLGSKIRYSDIYSNFGGTNVNFVQQSDDHSFLVRTYERGVEDETYSCGTGVTAVAITAHATGKTNFNKVNLATPGGNLEVSFDNNGAQYSNIWLTGPALQVFKGSLEC